MQAVNRPLFGSIDRIIIAARTDAAITEIKQQI
jgi:hypothetical protein